MRRRLHRSAPYQGTGSSNSLYKRAPSAGNSTSAGAFDAALASRHPKNTSLSLVATAVPGVRALQRAASAIRCDAGAAISDGPLHVAGWCLQVVRSDAGRRMAGLQVRAAAAAEALHEALQLRRERELRLAGRHAGAGALRGQCWMAWRSLGCARPRAAATE